MKKVSAILFILLYAASFSGMLWAKDCRANEGLNTSAAEAYQPCSVNAGHTDSSNEPHHLFQFCKIVETHKSVVATKQLKLANPFSSLLQSTYPSPSSLHAKNIKQPSYTITFSPNQLYIQYRVLLI